MTLEQYLRKHYTKKTAVVYAREIELYTRHYPDAAKATYKDIIAYIGLLRDRYSAATLNRILCSIKAYYDYLCRVETRSDNPAAAILLKDKRNRDVQLQDLFTPEELEALLHRRERYSDLESRNKVLISLLIYQGLHPAEMEAVRVEDINLHAGTIYIRSTGKTNGRELSLRPGQVMLFYQYIQEVRPRLLRGGDCGVLLIGIRGVATSGQDITKHVKRSFKQLYPGRNVNAQTIRQSVIANLLKAGHDLSLVQGFAGHRYPGSTERYKQSEVATLKAAVQKYHPMK